MYQSQGEQYGFDAHPRVVKTNAKYRPEDSSSKQAIPVQNQSLQFDKRVVRGNTYAAIVTTTREASQQLKSTQKASSLKNTMKQQEYVEQDFIPREISTPPPVEGREHREVWTDDLVEILTDKPPNYEKDTQTDFYIDRPVNRLFMPQKTGEDRETQIWDGELFDFDYEVEPILQVLVGKTLEQSRMEVLEEEELATMKAQQKKYDELRYAELAEAQRLEAEEKRQLNESDRRKNQYQIKKDQAVTGHKKLISRVLAKKYLSNLRFNSFQILNDQGAFREPLELDLNRSFLPWIQQSIIHQLGSTLQIDSQMEQLNQAIESHMSRMHEDFVKKERETRRKKREDMDAEAKRKEEERARKREEKRKREEEQRRNELKERINETILSKAEIKEKIFTMIYSEIDSLGQDTSNIGLFGGVIGELLLLLSAIEEMSKEEHFIHFKSISYTPENLEKIIEFLLEELFTDGGFEIGVTDEFEKRLVEIREDLTLENFRTVGGNLRGRVEAAVRETLGSYGLNFIRENLENLGIREELYEGLLNAMAKHAMSKNEDYQKRIRLVKCDQNAKNPVALVVLKPNPSDVGAIASKDTKNTKKDSRKDSKTSSRTSQQGMVLKKQNTDEGSDTDERPEVELFEADYEEKVSVVPMANEQQERIMINHVAPALLLRREIINVLTTIFKEIDTTENDIVREICAKAKKVEELLAQQRPNLPIFEYDLY